MLSTARNILLMFGFLLLCGPVAAQNMDVCAAFLKCDGLMGKPPSVVSAALGAPPKTTEIISFYNHPAIQWNYPGQDLYIILTFLDGKLAEATLLSNIVMTGHPQFLKEFTAFMKQCKPSTYLFLPETLPEYFSQPGPLQDYETQIDTTTPNGNEMEAMIEQVCPKDLTPFTFKHVFNPTTGLYEDSCPKNPHFSAKNPVKHTLGLFLKSKSSSISKLSMWPTVGDFRDHKTISIPVTVSNSPWIYAAH